MGDIMSNTTELIYRLADLAQQGDYNIKRVVEIWDKIPIKDEDNLDYLSSINQCIIDISDMVESSNPALSDTNKMIERYRLMAEFLILKANLLEKSNNADMYT
jgi:hypothetical protein